MTFLKNVFCSSENYYFIEQTPIGGGEQPQTMNKIKEKKVSVKIATRDLKDGKALDCRVIYDKKSTKFKLVHVEMEGVKEENFSSFEQAYHDYYVSYVKGVVKYEINLLGDKFQLNKLGDRIGIHSMSILESLNKKFQNILIQKSGEILFYNEIVDVVGHDPLVNRNVNDAFFDNFYTYLSLRNFINSLQEKTSVEVYLLPLDENQKLGLISCLQLIHFQHYLYEIPKTKSAMAQDVDFGTWCADIGNIRARFGKFLADKLIGKVQTTDIQKFKKAEKNLNYSKEDIPSIMNYLTKFSNENHPLNLIKSYYI